MQSVVYCLLDQPKFKEKHIICHLCTKMSHKSTVEIGYNGFKGPANFPRCNRKLVIHGSNERSLWIISEKYKKYTGLFYFDILYLYTYTHNSFFQILFISNTYFHHFTKRSIVQIFSSNENWRSYMWRTLTHDWRFSWLL